MPKKNPLTEESLRQQYEKKLKEELKQAFNEPQAVVKAIAEGAVAEIIGAEVGLKRDMWGRWESRSNWNEATPLGEYFLRKVREYVHEKKDELFANVLVGIKKSDIKSLQTKYNRLLEEAVGELLEERARKEAEVLVTKMLGADPHATPFPV